jgi:cytochrome c-type biogenesis protein CcmI
VIWFIFLAVLAICAAYLLYPFLAEQAAPAALDLDQARQLRAGIDLDEAEGRLTAQAAIEARDALDRRILSDLDSAPATGNGKSLRQRALIGVPAIMLIGGATIYTLVGSPGLTPVPASQNAPAQAVELPDSLDQLVIELRDRLAADPAPPADGYVLLARSYFRLGQVENGLAAYDTAIEISGGDDVIVNERDRVIQALQNRVAAPPMDPEARARIEAMSPDEQAEMIANMVAGLAVRLEQDPNDLDGWLRLIRARTVMGEVAQARADLATALTAFADDRAAQQALTELADQLLPAIPEATADGPN